MNNESGRRANDQSATLWSGWALEKFITSSEPSKMDSAIAKIVRKGAIYFAGFVASSLMSLRSVKTLYICSELSETRDIGVMLPRRKFVLRLKVLTPFRLRGCSSRIRLITQRLERN